MKSGKRSIKRFQLLTWAVGLTSFLLVIGVGGAAAAVRMESSATKVSLNGFHVGGIDLAGLDSAAAMQKLNERFEAPLDKPVAITIDGRTLEPTTRRELGATTNVADVYRRAVELHRNIPFFKRLWYRITGMSVGQSLEVQTRVDGDKGAAQVAKIAQEVNKAPVNATISVAGGSFKIVDAVPGYALDEEAAVKAFEAASAGEASRIALVGKPVAASITRENFKDVIVVKVGENKLYHYEGESLVKTYDVATGLPKYPTPIGQFRIVEKRFRPTWVNPAKGPGEWGFKLPAKIGPGPTNPLGTRAMNLNSPGIRIHGTTADNSMGYNASHGCIRMRMSDVEELFERVDVGTPVIIQSAGPARMMPSPPKAPTLQDLVESNGTAAQVNPPAAPAAPAAAPSAPSAPPAPPAAPAVPRAQPGEPVVPPLDLDLGND
ncbi:MAG TPA: L,D-transpeptidase/peptidoglycan binding protein [Actinomycetota bacterium]|nr:L,D-transpeptidase/peptidoglycan binding protein [Actinomycetota bacterium]